jgi:hypothetical protein
MGVSRPPRWGLSTKHGGNRANDDGGFGATRIELDRHCPSPAPLDHATPSYSLPRVRMRRRRLRPTTLPPHDVSLPCINRRAPSLLRSPAILRPFHRPNARRCRPLTSVSAFLGIAPPGELPDSRLQHLIGMEARIFPQHRPRERGDQHLRRMAKLEMPRH